MRIPPAALAAAHAAADTDYEAVRLSDKASDDLHTLAEHRGQSVGEILEVAISRLARQHRSLKYS